jgi:hypothetical protein
MLMLFHRLRQVDIKAEHFERAVQRAEQERDAIEKKLDVRLPLWFAHLRFTDLACFILQEANDKLKASQKELEELVSQMDSLVSSASVTRKDIRLTQSASLAK